MRCTFCATGKGGFARNLMPHEIADQVLTVGEAFGQRVSNVVFMGMGEPLLNLPSVMRAHAFLTQDLGIGARHVTISTVGVPNALRQLAAHVVQSTLAVSIHAPTQALREQIVPSARAYPLEALMQDCAQYFEVTGRRVTFEYCLLAGVNDAAEQAEELAALLRRHGGMRSHVNLIPWNPVDESEFARPSRAGVARFVAALERRGVTVSVRHTRGLEAAAACGQLRNMHQKQPLPGFAAPA
jgi:23S rRNA (adenine2503-C2)-methyltransferase